MTQKFAPLKQTETLYHEVLFRKGQRLHHALVHCAEPFDEILRWAGCGSRRSGKDVRQRDIVITRWFGPPVAQSGRIGVIISQVTGASAPGTISLTIMASQLIALLMPV